jgi:hypothetical protein
MTRRWRTGAIGSTVIVKGCTLGDIWRIDVREGSGYRHELRWPGVSNKTA